MSTRLPGIVPPHLLRELARNGNEAERNVALHTLAADRTIRLLRPNRESGVVDRRLMGTPTVRKLRTIYDAPAELLAP